MSRRWDDERSASDAPVWLGAEEAAAWASGWNAAVRSATDQLDDVFDDESGHSALLVWEDAKGDES